MFGIFLHPIEEIEASVAAQLSDGFGAVCGVLVAGLSEETRQVDIVLHSVDEAESLVVSTRHTLSRGCRTRLLDWPGWTVMLRYELIETQSMSPRYSA